MEVSNSFLLRIKNIFLLSISIIFLFCCKNEKNKSLKSESKQSTVHAQKEFSYKNPLGLKVADPFILDNGDGTYSSGLGVDQW